MLRSLDSGWSVFTITQVYTLGFLAPQVVNIPGPKLSIQTNSASNHS